MKTMKKNVPRVLRPGDVVTNRTTLEEGVILIGHKEFLGMWLSYTVTLPNGHTEVWRTRDIVID